MLDNEAAEDLADVKDEITEKEETEMVESGCSEVDKGIKDTVPTPVPMEN